MKRTCDVCTWEVHILLIDRRVITKVTYFTEFGHAALHVCKASVYCALALCSSCVAYMVGNDIWRQRSVHEEPTYHPMVYLVRAVEIVGDLR